VSDQRDLISDSIAKAQDNLEHALSELENLPATDMHSVAFAIHALNNYLMVTDGIER
jgi:hypothetical protein